MDGERSAGECEGARCASCPVESGARCLGLEARANASRPDRLCELAARDGRYAIELRRLAGESNLPPRRR